MMRTELKVEKRWVHGQLFPHFSWLKNLYLASYKEQLIDLCYHLLSCYVYGLIRGTGKNIHR